MRNEDLRFIAATTQCKTMNEVHRLNAMNKLIDIVESNDLIVDGIRGTANGNLNLGDLAEVVLNALYQQFQGKKAQASRKYEGSRDCSIKWNAIEFKVYVNAKYKASHSSLKNRYIALQWNKATNSFDVKYFTKEQASAIINKKSMDINLATDEIADKEVINEFKQYLSEVVA